MTSVFRKSALLALLGTSLSLSSFAQHGGNALQFTSTESDRALVNIDAPRGAFTLEAWVYFNGSSYANAGSYNTILEFGNDAPWVGVNGQGELEVYGVLRGGTVPVRTWTHVAYTWDGIMSRLYINGTPVNTAPAGPTQTGIALGIGFHSGDTGWQGYIDEVMIWDMARSPQDIQNDRQNGVSGAMPLLLGYFRFEEAGGQVIVNQVSSGPNGILGQSGVAETSDPVRTSTIINGTRPESTGARLESSYPNPFQGRTTIPFTLRRPSHVCLRVLDVTGREVATLVDANRPAGQHTALFEASHLTAGLYVSQLTVDGETQTRRLVVR